MKRASFLAIAAATVVMASYGFTDPQGNGIPDVEHLGLLTEDHVVDNPSFLGDGVHMFPGPPVGLLSTVTVPMHSKVDPMGQLVAQRVAEVLARRQLVDFLYGEEVVSERRLEQGERSVSVSGGRMNPHEVVTSWLDHESLMRIRSEGFLVGVKPVAKWVSHENGESILHMIFIVTKKDLLETARK